MKFEGVTFPHPEVRVEVTTFDLERISEALSDKAKKDSDPAYLRIRADIESILARVRTAKS